MQKKMRLDKYLSKFYKAKKLSRSEWQKLIKNGAIKINGKQTTPHYIIKPEDKIEIIKTERAAAAGKIAQKIPKIPIMHETDDYVVINKPVGLIVYPEGLADWILKKYPKNAKIKDRAEKTARFGIAHRLDKETSGVMVIAKNQKMFDCLRAQFKSRTVEKKYIALVHGNLPKNAGVIDFPIGRSAQGRMAARPIGIKASIHKEQEGREARTEYTAIKKFLHYTLVEAKPITGRTHQIRVHFFAIGHPVAGDSIYKFKSGMGGSKPGKKEPSAPRLMLHAKELCFGELQKKNAPEKRACFAQNPPKVFNDFLKKCKV